MTFENGNDRGPGTNFGEDPAFGRDYPPSRDEEKLQWVYLWKLAAPVLLLIAALTLYEYFTW